MCPHLLRTLFLVLFLFDGIKAGKLKLFFYTPKLIRNKKELVKRIDIDLILIFFECSGLMKPHDDDHVKDGKINYVDMNVYSIL